MAWMGKEELVDADWDGYKAACPTEVENWQPETVVWSPGTSRGRQGARNRRCSQRMGNRRRGEKARKTVAIIQAASGCYSIVTVRRRPFRIIYSGSYVSVQVADAARIADRSFLADPTASSAIAPICLTASKSLEPTRDYPETHKSSSSRLCPTLLGNGAVLRKALLPPPGPTAYGSSCLPRSKDYRFPVLPAPNFTVGDKFFSCRRADFLEPGGAPRLHCQITQGRRPSPHTLWALAGAGKGC
jgi:hypothetical protein